MDHPISPSIGFHDTITGAFDDRLLNTWQRGPLFVDCFFVSSCASVSLNGNKTKQKPLWIEWFCPSVSLGGDLYPDMGFRDGYGFFPCDSVSPSAGSDGRAMLLRGPAWMDQGTRHGEAGDGHTAGCPETPSQPRAGAAVPPVIPVLGSGGRDGAERGSGFEASPGEKRPRDAVSKASRARQAEGDGVRVARSPAESRVRIPRPSPPQNSSHGTTRPEFESSSRPSSPRKIPIVRRPPKKLKIKKMHFWANLQVPPPPPPLCSLFVAGFR
jgi:hypothetical protein